MLERTTLPLDTVLPGDSLAVLQTIPEGSTHCCVTSPPYYALRDYEAEGQIGRESTPEEYIERLVKVFHEVKRVLRPDGTFWLNIADTYCKHPRQGAKRKDMLGIPWRLALVLRNDGWYLRSNIIWEKGNAMPESVTDRCNRSATAGRNLYFGGLSGGRGGAGPVLRQRNHRPRRQTEWQTLYRCRN